MTNKEKLQTVNAVMQKQALLDFGHNRRMNEWDQNVRHSAMNGSGLGAIAGSIGGTAGAIGMLGSGQDKPMRAGWERLTNAGGEIGEALWNPRQSAGGLMSAVGSAEGFSKLKPIGKSLKKFGPLALLGLLSNTGSSAGGNAGGLMGAGVGYAKQGPPPKQRLIGF